MGVSTTYHSEGVQREYWDCDKENMIRIQMEARATGQKVLHHYVITRYYKKAHHLGLFLTSGRFNSDIVQKQGGGHIKAAP